MEKLELKINEIARSVGALDKKVALIHQDVGYTRKEIEGNGKKGLIKKVDELEDKHDQDMKTCDRRIDKVVGFNNKIVGGLIASQVLIGVVITLVVKFT